MTFIARIDGINWVLFVENTTDAIFSDGNVIQVWMKKLNMGVLFLKFGTLRFNLWHLTMLQFMM